ncbi:mono/diheme cytochrome c family protein [Edaphobacter lichenicola]|uniref:Mono/diheme cytochrome c family protein n=2 Tax=Tunturiibacter empetritectus TaxID=3069691 RepID=A0A7W8IJ30_9BACT|nr:mono/diheme cytochrome c family protein [Edaphobacter lichenicola]
MYARIAPGSWLIERDIVEARKKMDLSQWEEVPPDRQDVLMSKIVQEAKSGEMPPLQYRLLHWDAALSKADVLTLSMLGKSEGKSEAASEGADDAARGRALFERRCTGCHAMEVDREGPGSQAGLAGKREHGRI